MAAGKSTKPKCMVAGCDNLSQQRGVCKTCFRENSRLVEAGDYTDKQLVELRLWKPECKRGPKPAERVQKVLRRRLAKSK